MTFRKKLHYTPTNAALLYTISGVMVLVFKLLHGALANIDYVNIFRPIYQYIFFYFVGGIATICLVIKTSYGIYFYSACNIKEVYVYSYSPAIGPPIS
jgi:hypothetical protein